MISNTSRLPDDMALLMPMLFGLLRTNTLAYTTIHLHLTFVPSKFAPFSFYSTAMYPCQETGFKHVLLPMFFKCLLSLETCDQK